MIEKTFLVKMNDEKKCCMSRYYESYHHCVWAEVYPTPKFEDQCKGKSDNRPAWCPLYELREARTHDVMTKTVWVKK